MSYTTLKTSVAVAIAAAGLFAQAALADTQTTSQTMEVRLTVLKSCSFSTQAMEFGSQSYTTTTDLTASSTLQVTCSKNTPFNITTASNDFNLRPEAGVVNGQPIPFTLYADHNRTQAVNSSSALSGSGTGSASSVTIYGKIPASALASASAGNYSATVTLNLTY